MSQLTFKTLLMSAFILDFERVSGGASSPDEFYKVTLVGTTAGNVYLADSAQVPRIQAKYTADSSQVPWVHVQVLGHGRGVPKWKLHEEESKYTKATAEVYLLSSDCNVAMLPRTMQPELELFEVDGIGDDGDDDLWHHYFLTFKQLYLGF